MGYVCRDCNRTANLPDYCHGQAMVSEGSFVCDNCGSTASAQGTCCGQKMSSV